MTHKRGRKRLTSAKEDKNLISVRNQTEKDNPKKNVVARMLKARWRTQKPVSARTVSRRLNQQGKTWLRNRKKLHLSDQQKLRRQEWGEKYKSKSLHFWQHCVLHTDDKTFAYNTSQEARRKARTQRKTHTYRSGDEGLYFSVPCKLKHRQGNNGVHVCAALAQGKCVVFEYYDGPQITADKYAYLLSSFLAPALSNMMENIDSVPHMLRDGAPQRGTKAGKGKEAEELAGLKVIQQEGDSPDTQVCDYWFWHDLNERMAKQEEDWEAQHPGQEFNETMQEFKVRLRRTALRTSSANIHTATGSMKRRCKELAEGDGAWIKGD